MDVQDYLNIWGVIAINFLLIENFIFIRMLKRNGIKVPFIGQGTLFYPDFLYFKWCKLNRKSPLMKLMIRFVLVVNVIIWFLFKKYY